QAVERGDVEPDRVAAVCVRLDERRPRAGKRIEDSLPRREVPVEEDLDELGDELAEVGVQPVDVLRPQRLRQLVLGPRELEIEFARGETIDFVPSWYGERQLEIGRQHCARIALAGPTAPGALDGLDPARAGKDQLPYTREGLQTIAERLVNWTVVPSPSVGWA